MLYVYYGDKKEAQRKAHILLAGLAAKKPDATITYFDPDTFVYGNWEELVAGQGLFVRSLLFYGAGVCEHSESVEFLEKHIKEIKESPNIFIFAEQKMPVALKRVLEKNAEKFVELEEGKVAIKERVDLFALTDAVGARRAKDAFLLYEDALIKGASADEVHPLLWWQLKNIYLVKTLKQQSLAAAEAIGIKPYPFKKALAYSEKFEEKELKQMLKELVDMFHIARTSGTELEFGILKFLLKI
jgi:hypothetical protein